MSPHYRAMGSWWHTKPNSPAPWGCPFTPGPSACTKIVAQTRESKSCSLLLQLKRMQKLNLGSNLPPLSWRTHMGVSHVTLTLFWGGIGVPGVAQGSWQPHASELSPFFGCPGAKWTRATMTQPHGAAVPEQGWLINCAQLTAARAFCVLELSDTNAVMVSSTQTISGDLSFLSKKN